MNERQEQTADVLGKLTVLGTIVLPMNIITGMWGMNVPVPGQDSSNVIWFWSSKSTKSLYAKDGANHVCSHGGSICIWCIMLLHRQKSLWNCIVENAEVVVLQRISGAYLFDIRMGRRSWACKLGTKTFKILLRSSAFQTIKQSLCWFTGDRSNFTYLHNQPIDIVSSIRTSFLFVSSSLFIPAHTTLYTVHLSYGTHSYK